MTLAKDTFVLWLKTVVSYLLKNTCLHPALQYSHAYLPALVLLFVFGVPILAPIF
jgi:hypothetical protein